MSTASKAAVTVTEAWLLGPLKTPFYTKTWSVERPERVVVFVHGFNEHVTRYNHYFTLLAQLTSSRIFAFDQRGFGHTAHTSPPTELLGTDCKRSKKGVTHTDLQRRDIEFFIRKEAGESRNGKVWVYGHSMGGALVLGIPTYAANHASSTPQGEAPLSTLLEGIVCSSPLIQQTTPAPKWQVSLGSSLASVGSIFANRHIPAPLDLNQLSRDPVKVEENKNDPMCPQTASLGILGSMLQTGPALLTNGAPANWPVDLPLLIIHGSADAITSPTASATFHSSLPSAHTANKYISVPEGYHELHNEPKEVWEGLAKDVADFVVQRSSGGGGGEVPRVEVTTGVEATGQESARL